MLASILILFLLTVIISIVACLTYMISILSEEPEDVEVHADAITQFDVHNDSASDPAISEQPGMISHAGIPADYSSSSSSGPAPGTYNRDTTSLIGQPFADGLFRRRPGPTSPSQSQNLSSLSPSQPTTSHELHSDPLEMGSLNPSAAVVATDQPLQSPQPQPPSQQPPPQPQPPPPSAPSPIGDNQPLADPWSLAAADTQRQMLINELGVVVAKQIVEDFDPRDVQLGGTPLHWCKSRKSLDKLIKLHNMPIGSLNSRAETPLHVAVRRRRLAIAIGLLCQGCQVDVRDGNGETPLIVAAKLGDVHACQLLLVFDADVDSRDKLNMSARHYVAVQCSRNRPNAAPAQTTQPTNPATSASTAAANKQPVPLAPNPTHLLLAMLHEMGAKRCPEWPTTAVAAPATAAGNQSTTADQCTTGCAANGLYDGTNYGRWVDLERESLHKRHMFCDIIDRCKRQLSATVSPGHEKSLDSVGLEPVEMSRVSRILCIDGGGMRGVIVCQILIELEKRLERPVLSYFDWVGGTSVGAYMACALALGTTLKELRQITFDVKDEIFNGVRPYNPKFLERVLKRTYGLQTRMSDIRGRKLAVTTVIADREPCQLRMFRNYMAPARILENYGFQADKLNTISGRAKVEASLARRGSVRRTSARSASPSLKSTSLATGENNKTDQTKPNDPKAAGSNAPKRPSAGKREDASRCGECNIDEYEQDPLVWQAVRASAAAPFFFKPYGPYLDGGIISNNPTLDMMVEFENMERVKSFLRARLEENATMTGPSDDSQASFDGASILVHREKPRQLDMVVSLGCGRGRVMSRKVLTDFGSVASGLAKVFSPVELLRSIRSARDLFKSMVQHSCNTEDHVLDRAQAWCSSLNIPYFRINPPLTTVFSIDDKRDEQLINALWQTKLYMRSMNDQLQDLCDLLDGPTRRARLDRERMASSNEESNDDNDNEVDDNNNDSTPLLSSHE